MGHGVDGRHTAPTSIDPGTAREVAQTMQALATPSRVRILGRSARRRPRSASSPTRSGWSAPPSPTSCACCATSGLSSASGAADGRLRAPRLTRRRPARPGRLPRRARPPRLRRTDQRGVLSHHARSRRAGPDAPEPRHDAITITDEHGHSHGLVDRSIVRSREGVRAVSISLAVLALTAGAQVAIFALSGSVALLADLIHNFGDALTAIPLGIAFFLRSRPRREARRARRRARDLRLAPASRSTRRSSASSTRST